MIILKAIALYLSRKPLKTRVGDGSLPHPLIKKMIGCDRLKS
jgi:hypothetical protein